MLGKAAGPSLSVGGWDWWTTFAGGASPVQEGSAWADRRGGEIASARTGESSTGGNRPRSAAEAAPVGRATGTSIDGAGPTEGDPIVWIGVWGPSAAARQAEGAEPGFAASVGNRRGAYGQAAKPNGASVRDSGSHALKINPAAEARAFRLPTGSATRAQSPLRGRPPNICRPTSGSTSAT